MLARERERILGAEVVGAEHHHQLGQRRRLGERAVGPGVGRPAALEVDVRAQDAAEPRRTRRTIRRWHPGTVGSDEELLELSAERAEGRRVRSSRQGRESLP